MQPPAERVWVTLDLTQPEPGAASQGGQSGAGTSRFLRETEIGMKRILHSNIQVIEASLHNSFSLSPGWMDVSG